MVQNIGFAMGLLLAVTYVVEKVLERGERIELLVDKTETLENTAVKFKTSSRTLKKAMVNCFVAVLIG